MTTHDAKDYGALWAPDSARLVFVSDRFGKPEVCTVDLAGKVKNLSRHAAKDHQPALSPDGKRVLFVSDRDGNDEIYVMNADGKDVRRLTRRPGRDYAPAWLR